MEIIDRIIYGLENLHGCADKKLEVGELIEILKSLKEERC